MAWIDEQPDSLLKSWLERTHAPMLATLPSGEILWVNASFEQLLGYTAPELVGRITWKQLTDDTDDLEADVALSQQTINGDRENYLLQKPYRTKHGPQKRVVIDVLRYPSHGEFECFLVTALPTDRGIEFAMGQLADLRELCLEIAANSQRGVTFESVAKVYEEHPVIVTIVGLVIGTLLFGDRVLEIFNAIARGG